MIVAGRYTKLRSVVPDDPPRQVVLPAAGPYPPLVMERGVRRVGRHMVDVVGHVRDTPAARHPRTGPKAGSVLGKWRRRPDSNR